MSDNEEEYLELLEWRDLKARWKRDIGLDDFDVGLVCSYACTVLKAYFAYSMLLCGLKV